MRDNDESSEQSEVNEDEESASKEHVYKWRKQDITYNPGAFDMQLEDVPEDMTPYKYFKLFWTDNSLIVWLSILIYITYKRAPNLYV